MIKRIAIRLAGLCSVILLASCGGKAEKNSEGLAIMVLPEKNAYLVDGTFSSCTNIAEWLADPDVGLSRSVTGPAIRFNSFALQWLRTDQNLNVTRLRLTFTGSGIKDSEYVVNVDFSELLVMVNDSINGSGVISGKAGGTTISTNADTRKIKCGFVIGEIALANGLATPAFTGTVRVELSGYASDAAGNTAGSLHAETKATFVWEP